MTLFKYLIFVTAALFSCCSSEAIGEVAPVQCLECNIDKSLQRILEILAVQDEKINRIHAKVITNQLLPKCLAALNRADIQSGVYWWKDLMAQVRTLDQSTETEYQILSQLIKDYNNDGPINFLHLAMFIENNVEKGSELAIGSYKVLLDAMDNYGHLYLKNTSSEIDLQVGSTNYILRTLIKIRKAEGDDSPLFTKPLTSYLNSLLSGREVYILNNVTRDYLYAAASGSSDSETKILVDGIKQNSSRYLWTLRQTDLWYPYTFYVVNSFDDKILAMTDENGSMGLIEKYESLDKSSRSMFYIRLVQGSSGEEVAIQCYNERIFSLGLDENEEGKIPKMLLTAFPNTPNGVWVLQQKEEETF